MAMKFLLRKLREVQTDLYEKRGINWHISVTIHKAGDNVKTTTHVYLFSFISSMAKVYHLTSQNHNLKK